VPRQRASVPELAIITPVFNEVDGLKAYFETVERVFFNAPGIDARLILVDDGSTDGSWDLICQASNGSSRISGVRLSRNFGAHVALMAGLEQVSSSVDVAAFLAADLQDPPEKVLEFIKEWRAGADIVWGSRRQRSDSAWRRVASSIMEGTLRRHAMPPNSKFRTGSFLLLDRVVIDCFLRYRESTRVTFALVAWTGFQQTVVEYDRRRRETGRSGWSFGKMVNTAYDALIGHSQMPARLVTSIGFITFILSNVAIAFMIVDWIMRRVQPGWTGLMVTVTFFFGLLFMMMGMITEYLYRIFVETKNRPLYFIADRTGLPPELTGQHD